MREYWHSRGAYALANTDNSHLIQYPTHLFQALNIPVKSFQEDPTTWDIHKVRCTGPRGFRDQDPREDWVWVRLGDITSYGVFREHLPGRLKVLFSICPSEFSTEEQTLVLV